MSDNTFVLGRVAVSKAGRDKGRAFLIIGIVDEDHVHLADGEMHKLSRPKKKKLKHIKIEDAAAESVKEKLAAGTKVFDAEVRRSLILLGYNKEEEQEG